MTVTHVWGPPGNYSFAREHHAVEFWTGGMDEPAPNVNVGHLRFQDGPIAEHGVNGVTNEEVLEVVLERLESLNKPPYNCRENSLAITKLEEALMWLEHRTRSRVARGVEGTSTV